MLRFLWRFVAFLAEMNGYTPFFQALFKANLAIIVGGLSRSEWVGMLRFRQMVRNKIGPHLQAVQFQPFTCSIQSGACA